MTGKGDTARYHHLTARDEILLRIRLRDYVIMLYLSAIGTIFGFAISIDGINDILFIIPFLSLGASLLISQHQELIGTIGQYIVTELHPYFIKIEEDAPQWDMSVSLINNLSNAIWERTISHCVLIIVPSTISLVITSQYWNDTYSYPFTVWWIGVLLTIISLIIISRSHIIRFKNKEAIQNHNEDVVPEHSRPARSSRLYPYIPRTTVKRKKG